LGDYIIGYFAGKKNHMSMCLILKGYGDRVVGIYRQKSIVNSNKIIHVKIAIEAGRDFKLGRYRRKFVKIQICQN
jgi:hypothetical protein